MSTRTFIRRCTFINFKILKHGYTKNCPRFSSTLNNVNFNSKYCRPRIDPKYFSYDTVKFFSNDKPSQTEEKPKKLGLVARFKQMYKEYWYVLVPVHLVTSIGWFSGFYFMAKR